MSSATWFVFLVVAVAAERLLELRVARRNLRWILARGGVEYGSSHYPAMVVLHAALLVGAVAEVWLLHRPFLPWFGWPMLVLVTVAQGLRWWCIRTLGPQWNTRVVVATSLPLISRGPYRWLRHPNYVAVVVEGLALPLTHSAWITATVFTVLDVFVLRVRIRTEKRSLAAVAS